ncbi:MAG: GWxTD domain-containing protein [Bacteroidota bacterium]|nr:GWxTD domain-containing protein [Bacteroidota bacterium]
MLIRKVFIVFTFTLLFPLLIVVGQQYKDLPVTSNGDILFFVDHSGFRGKEDKTYEEFYFMMPADQVNYKDINGEKQGSVKIRATLKNNSGKVIKTKEWTTVISLPKDKDLSKGLGLYDQWSTGEISPGSYAAEFEISDLLSTSKGAASFEVEIPLLSQDSFSSSQLEFVTRMEKTSGASQFTKGELSIIPNPSRRFGILNPVVYLYYELYNITPKQNDGKNLSATYSIRSMDGHIVKTFPPIEIKRAGQSASIFHGISVATIPSGVYDLIGEISDSSSNKKISLMRRFEVMQFTQAKSSQPKLTEEQAKISGKIIQYIAPDKFSDYEKLDLSGKARFLVEFWKQLDPSPGTDENEYLQKIIQRYQFANQNFGWGKVEGWATDRGRVLIKYGNPDEVERHEFETDSVPYEIWYYRQDKSYMFIFADQKSNGRYSLIHSTKEGEVHNPYWAEQIKKM